MLRPEIADEEAIAAIVRSLAEPLLEPAEGVRAVVVRLSRLQRPSSQAPLFPATPELRRA